jgi:DNA polymerase V
MQVLSRYTDEMEEYSIDEAFLNFPPKAITNPAEYAAEIRYKVDRMIGIPVSIGVSSTKTLAKLASEIAKKKCSSGVMQITVENAPGILDDTPVGDVWGIGRKSAQKLSRWGVHTAGDLARKDSAWVKKTLNVRGLMTQYELRGRPCIPMVTEAAPPKSIQVSRTFGAVLDTKEDITCAILGNLMKAGMFLRRNKLAAGAMEVCIRHGYLHHGECGYFSEDMYFRPPIFSDIELINAARQLIERIYHPGYRYTQGGVMLYSFDEARYRQRELFDEDESQEKRAKFERLSAAIDEINGHYGARMVFPAALADADQKWKPQRAHVESRDKSI